jgi:hypothetical protein
MGYGFGMFKTRGASGCCGPRRSRARQAHYQLLPRWTRSKFKMGRSYAMKKRTQRKIEQPDPFTPAVTKAMVRQHAYEMFRDKLPDHPLTLEDWILAEKDLVSSMDSDNLLK